MMKRRLPWLACLAIILAGMLARASAQTIPLDDDALDEKLSRSHLINEKFGLPAGSPEELFLQRVKTIHTKEIGEGVGKKLTREDLDQFSQNQDFVKEYLKKFKITDLPAELREKFAGREDLEKFIQSMDLDTFVKYARQAQGLGPLPEAGAAQPATDPPTTPPTTAEPGSASGSPPGSESRIQEGTASDVSSGDPSANSVVGRWLLKAANHFKDLDPAIGNSPRMHRIMRELSRHIEGTDEHWKKLDKGMTAIADKFTRLGEALPLDRLVPEHGFSWPRGLTAEAWPKLRIPEPGPARVPSYSMPRTGIPEMTGWDSWRVLSILVFLTAVGLILWKTARRAPGHGVGGGGTWQLGPWPVHPTEVQTREELIQAFEYLSVLRLGPAARHWHHLTIAASLGLSAVSGTGWGNSSAERRRAAEQLAFLYERARYAPPVEPFPEAALATARRDLCLLAGVHAL